ncbi:hypothetical protein [Symmachiella dynata]|uniref:hypothetical protein n=1 Tax=Symmachiella dynata TaxID=2527995 RepID=UPI0011A5196E|nr:hypothetical protein [Symmachiella dynata]
MCDTSNPCEKCKHKLKGKEFSSIVVEEAANAVGGKLMSKRQEVVEAKEKQKPECTVWTKYGDVCRLDLSASRIKRLRRERKHIEMKGDDGKPYVLDCSKITKITPRAS